MAAIRTLIVTILQKLKPTNMIERLEKYQDDFQAMIQDLRGINFL